jgi:hypothetical protein
LEGLSRAEIRQFIKNTLLIFEIEHKTAKKGQILFTSDYILQQLENNEKYYKRMSPTAEYQNQTSNENASLNNNFGSTTLGQDYAGYISHELEQQLYQNVASQHYAEITIILDKLTKGIILQTFERQILADNPFLLREEPQKALNRLNKAKMTIDKIKHLPVKAEKRN